MEFPDLGSHCSLSSCKQLDFLPFKCDACSNIFCKDHLTYDKHDCTKLHVKDRRVPVCPLCNQPVSLAANEDANQKVNQHIESDCKSDRAQHKRSKKCNVKGCKQRELIPVLCSACRQNFCLRHRHENDHECPAKRGSPSNRNASSASVRAGQVAVSRNSNSKPTSKKESKSTFPRPQQSSLSQIGSDLNRQRQTRQGVANSARVASLQGTGPSIQSSRGATMSEDEALALAIQASLSENNTADAPQETPAVDNLSQEEQDRALARALEESALEEQQRQRRSQNEQASRSKDSSCSIS